MTQNRKPLSDTCFCCAANHFGTEMQFTSDKRCNFTDANSILGMCISYQTNGIFILIAYEQKSTTRKLIIARWSIFTIIRTYTYGSLIHFVHLALNALVILEIIYLILRMCSIKTRDKNKVVTFSVKYINVTKMTINLI